MVKKNPTPYQLAHRKVLSPSVGSLFKLHPFTTLRHIPNHDHLFFISGNNIDGWPTLLYCGLLPRTSLHQDTDGRSKAHTWLWGNQAVCINLDLVLRNCDLVLLGGNASE